MSINMLLTVDEMTQADAAAVAAGVASLDLMEAAGGAVAEEIMERWDKRRVIVLCGPGNNGGDGFVVARMLDEAGWSVSIALLGEKGALKGDAAANAARWTGEITALSPDMLVDGALVVDALFGAGLSRPLDGDALTVVEAINERELDCVCVDVPSGIHGDTGEVMGDAPFAAVTVSFFRAKPGHVLLPGRIYGGEVIIADIGIPDAVLDEIDPQTFINGPDLWLDDFPWPVVDAHKYSRGHAVIVGGEVMTGAARLAAMAARRTGAGLVTLSVPPATYAIYAGDSPGTLVSETEDATAFDDLLADHRKNTVLVGPGAGLGQRTRDMALSALSAHKRCVFDADALSVFADDRGTLLDRLNDRCLLTPHDGEFARLFPETMGSRLDRARAAARECGAAVLLKGPDTVIAAPDGRAVINASGSPDLATGGTGDVLAGMAVALMAQGVSSFGAGTMAAWLHGAAAEAVGPGLIAEDLPEFLPEILRELLEQSGHPA